MRRPNESAYTDEMRIYGDAMHGNRVIVGLTPEESEEYEDIMDHDDVRPRRTFALSIGAGAQRYARPLSRTA